MTPLESKLRKMAAALDATTLEALANKGLLRRAQKDLERGGAIAILSQEESLLTIQVAEYEVKIPEAGPARAVCSCPATGVCQHILRAVLFLQQSSTQAPEPSLPATEGEKDELMSITPEALEEWAGKASFKRGLHLATLYPPEIRQERGIRIRLPALNAEVHYVPGGGLAGMIVSAGKTNEQQLVVAAVVGFQRANGKEWAAPDGEGPLETAVGAPRTRNEVLESCQTLLEETLANGLARLSASNQQRWTTLAVSALGVSLPRLALLLRGIGDEANLALARDARSDTGRMLERMARAHALCSALQNAGASPRADLVGAHRTRYDEVGHVDLIGAAAWPWRTASGYEGLTLLFWDASTRQWNSWSDSRPLLQLAGFNPVTRYTQPGPWEGAQSPRQLARNSFRLMNARRNANQRLSGSSKSRVLVTGSARLEDQELSAVSDWSELSQRLSASAAVGLKEANPLDSIFAVKPATWGERGFNPVTQIFTWILGDRQERSIRLQILFDDLTHPAIKFLEGVTATSLSNALVVAQVQLTPSGLSLHPYSIHQQDGGIIHLSLDGVAATASHGMAAQNEDNELLEMEDEEQGDAMLSPAIRRVLDEVDDSLLALAESGLVSASSLRIERVAQNARRAERVNLHVLAIRLQNISDQPSAASTLRCCYVSQLHRRVDAAE